MKRKDRQIAFREKVALCFIILMMNLFILFYIVGLNYILCPKKNQLSPGQVSAQKYANSDALVYSKRKYLIFKFI